jgi:hypothetical protein
MVARPEDLPDRLLCIGGFDFAAAHFVEFRAGLPLSIHPSAHEFTFRVCGRIRHYSFIVTNAEVCAAESGA